MRCVASVLALAVALTFVGKLSAADDQASPAKSHHHAMMAPWDILNGLTLTADQKAKVKELGKEYRPKFKAAFDSILTDEQKKARDDAVSAAKANSKKGTRGHEGSHGGGQADRRAEGQAGGSREALEQRGSPKADGDSDAGAEGSN